MSFRVQNNTNKLYNMQDNSLSSTINSANAINTAGLGVTPEDQTYIDAQRAAMQQPTEIGEQDRSSLFPGANQNINVGTYSGSVVGSNPIYVPTGDVYGFNLDLAQKKKDEEATIARNQLEASRGKFDIRKPKELDDKYFQKSILDLSNKSASNFTNKAYDMYGADAKFVLENPQQFDIGKQYIQEMDSYDLLVGQGNQMTTLLASMQKNIEDGTKVYSDETLAKLNEYQNKMGDFESGDVNSLVGLRDVMTSLEGGKAMDEYLSDKGIMKSIVAKVTKNTSIKDGKDIPGYATLTKNDKKTYDDNIKELVSGWIGPGGEFRKEFIDNLVTEESLTKKMKGYLQNESDRTPTIVNTSTGGAGNRISDLQNDAGAPNKKVFTNPDGSTYSFETTDEIKVNTSKNNMSTTGLVMYAPTGPREPLQVPGGIRVVSLNNTPTLNIEEGKTNGKDEMYQIAIIEYDVEEQVVSGEDALGSKTYKTVKKTVQAPVVFDDTLAEAMEADAKNNNREKGFARAALEKLRGVESDSAREARLLRETEEAE
jgi:hypothetical protein